MLIAKIGIFVGGALLVAFTISSAVRMLVVPRSDNVWLTRVVFLNTFKLFQAWIHLRRINTYEGRDHALAFFAPVTLLLMPVVWLILVTLGYAAMFWALGFGTPLDAYHLSGSSLLTLGFVSVVTPLEMVLVFSEATIGLGMVALLLAYLPTMYNAFSRREKSVAMLEVRAGSPPSAVEMISRIHRNRGMDYFEEFWPVWEEWFVELGESHTSLSSLIFFRSPESHRSWVTAAGAVLDAASIIESTVNTPPSMPARLCIRAGFIALRQIADFLRFDYDSNPRPTDPISISRDEFDEVYDQLESIGVPLKPDREQCWRDFAGWRVNYDSVLIALARFTMAPYAPWSSDRSRPLTLRGGRKAPAM